MSPHSHSVQALLPEVCTIEDFQPLCSSFCLAPPWSAQAGHLQPGSRQSRRDSYAPVAPAGRPCSSCFTPPRRAGACRAAARLRARPRLLPAPRAVIEQSPPQLRELQAARAASNLQQARELPSAYQAAALQAAALGFGHAHHADHADMHIMHMYGQHAWPACLVSCAFCLLCSCARLRAWCPSLSRAALQAVSRVACRPADLDGSPVHQGRCASAWSWGQSCRPTFANDVLAHGQMQLRFPCRAARMRRSLTPCSRACAA